MAPLWQSIGGSVRGADHIRRDLPNQDAYGWKHIDGGIVAALADGHGSANCFRSDVGSALAVSAASAVVDASTYRTPEDTLRHIVAGWRHAVEDHVAAHPFSDAETLAAWGRRADEPTDEQLIHVAYGTTLLVAAAVGDHVTLIQLGDGDIVLADSLGQVTRPVPTDDRLVANETTSMASPSAIDDFRIAQIELRPGGGNLVMLCSDGYTNSFATEDGFLSAASDYRLMIGDVGAEVVRGNLEKWLREHSDLGSGDDVTLGLLTQRAQ